MSDTIRTALLFLIDTLFNLYLFILVIRIILVWVRSDYFNPITQLVVRLTDGIVKPLRKLTPNMRYFETASFLLVIFIEMVKFSLISLISYGPPNLLGIPLLAIADILSLTIQAFTYAIIFQAILSFVQPMSPLMGVLSRFTSPIMQPIRRIIPPMGGLDLTPIPALIGLQLLSILLVGPLTSIGQNITFS